MIQLNAREAGRNGLTDGGTVLVTSPVGQVRARLSVDPHMRRDVVIAERGGWTKAGHGLNLLTLDLASKVGNGTPFYETPVAVLPASDKGKRILVVQNSDRAPGATFFKELERQGAALTTLRPADGELLPSGHDGFDGLVVLGGPQHAFDDGPSPYFPALMELMRGFDAAGKPVAGICLGAQLLARAHGGTPWSMDDLEFGFVAHSLTDAGSQDPVLGPAGAPPALMEFHEDSFDLPEGATLLVRGDRCPNQGFRIGNCSYGFQFHLEVDSSVVRNWIGVFLGGEMENYARYRAMYGDDFFTAFEARLPVLVARSEAFCRAVARNWLKLGSDPA